MSGCRVIGAGIDECEADVYDMADAHNRQVIKLIDILGQTGAGKRAVVKALAAKQGIEDDGELKVMFREL